MTDLKMPVMCGKELIEKVRDLEKRKKVISQIPVIVVSGRYESLKIGSNNQSDKQKCLNELKANYYLFKPLKSDKMKMILSKIKQVKSNSSLSISRTQVKQKKRVLIADDDALSCGILHLLMLEILKTFLVLAGYSCDICLNGTDVLIPLTIIGFSEIERRPQYLPCSSH